MNTLNIRKDNCKLDFLSMGALVHRLDPGTVPFRRARSVDIHVSGGEYNVAAGLADCFRAEYRYCHGHDKLRYWRDGAEPGSGNGCSPFLQVV